MKRITSSHYKHIRNISNISKRGQLISIVKINEYPLILQTNNNQNNKHAELEYSVCKLGAILELSDNSLFCPLNKSLTIAGFFAMCEILIHNRNTQSVIFGSRN